MQYTDNFRLLSPGKAGSHRTALYIYPVFPLFAVISCFHTTRCELAYSQLDMGIFNICDL